MAQLPAWHVPLIPARVRGLIRRLRRDPAPIDPALWRDVRTAVPWAAQLDPTRDQRLQALAARFLHEKTLTAVGDLRLDERRAAILATLCCLPLLEFGAEGMRGWSQLIVYPDAFRVNRTHVDAAGVLHQWDDELIGEAWETGPLILSWADVEADLAQPDAGFCVAVHEMAHKIDALDGLLDGTPPLPRAWQRQWARDFQDSYDRFVAVVERGGEPALDPYAAEAPEEFFAVCSEYHFSDPKRLQEAMPDVAGHLARFYGPSPFTT
ncbi:zinc-dependent peptidase [Luteimonas sp. SJ-92]|uniref:Zinc-dependent peptidase n=1 Tax=Luteimonas salinisoli TaxID=2752307 RepID=A0A853J8F0_9GAMM|nr:M90 family metallopeptidase [Luteimonas salinisoli]NZA25393.1 zinc-dependent peptidase [Luteimonas salinisoli]